MFRAHELIGALRSDSDDYRRAVAAIKFDLGELDEVQSVAALSRDEFYRLPAPLCLFQATTEMDLYFFLAWEDCDSKITTWHCFTKTLVDGFQWIQEDFELTIGFEGNDFSVKQLSNDENLDGRMGDSPLSMQWAVVWSCLIAKSMEVFACSNVKTIENAPPPFINSKRKRKGKVPFFSYKTLHVSTDERTVTVNTNNGTHASPRLHLRRGHIRRLSDGRRIWVVAHLVGDKSKGLSSHGYSMRKHNYNVGTGTV